MEIMLRVLDMQHNLVDNVRENSFLGLVFLIVLTYVSSGCLKVNN